MQPPSCKTGNTIFGDIMQEITKELQEKLWAEASAFVDNSSKKHLAHFGVTLESADNQYLELAFTCATNDAEYFDFLSIIDEGFLQVVRFEYSHVRIQEFACDIPIEVDFDRDDWQHIVQFSIGGTNTSVFNKFSYWKREHDKMTAGFRKSSPDFDTIYLAALKQMAKKIGISYEYSGDDIFEEMLVIESVIEEKLGGEKLV